MTDPRSHRELVTGPETASENLEFSWEDSENNSLESTTSMPRTRKRPFFQSPNLIKSLTHASSGKRREEGKGKTYTHLIF